MNFSGNIVIKAQLGDDIRRIPINNDEITYDELVIMMHRIFRDKANPDNDFVIKCKDEDGDFVTISDDSELTFSINTSKTNENFRTLRLLIQDKKDVNTSNENFENPPLDGVDRRSVVQELRKIRDFVTNLADKLDNVSMGSPHAQNGVLTRNKLHQISGEKQEFDPLTLKSNLAQQPKRTDTPESQFSVSANPPTVNSNENMFINNGSNPKGEEAPSMPPSNASTPAQMQQQPQQHQLPPIMGPGGFHQMQPQHHNLPGAVQMPPQSFGGPPTSSAFMQPISANPMTPGQPPMPPMMRPGGGPPPQMMQLGGPQQPPHMMHQGGPPPHQMMHQGGPPPPQMMQQGAQPPSSRPPSQMFQGFPQQPMQGNYPPMPHPGQGQPGAPPMGGQPGGQGMIRLGGPPPPQNMMAQPPQMGGMMPHPGAYPPPPQQHQ